MSLLEGDWDTEIAHPLVAPETAHSVEIRVQSGLEDAREDSALRRRKTRFSTSRLRGTLHLTGIRERGCRDVRQMCTTRRWRCGYRLRWVSTY